MSAPRAVRLPCADLTTTLQPPRRPAGGPAGYLSALGVVVLGAGMLLGALPASAAQGPVLLGRAESFAVLAGSGITNTGSTTINGDIGTFPTPSQTGFGSITLTGTNNAGNGVTQGAKVDLVTAYDDAAGRTPVTNVPVELGGSRLVAGVYTSPTLGLTGTLTLDAEGVADALFIFQAGSTLITEANSRVLLVNGASPCNVVWQVGTSATFKTSTQFVGDVLASTSITAQTRATFQGRLLAGTGAVTMDTNTITNAGCQAPDEETTTTTSAGTTSTTVATTPTTLDTTPTTLDTTSTAPATTSTTLDTTATTLDTTATTLDERGGPTTTAGTTPVTATPDHVDLNPGPSDASSKSLGGPAAPQTPGRATPEDTSTRSPGVPLRSTPDAPPTRTSLPATGSSALGLAGLGLALLVLGATAHVAGRNRRTR